jgi:hypothetical protein
MTHVVLVFPVWFAGSTGQSYGSIVESARSRHIPFFVSKTYCFALLFFQHEKYFIFILVASETNGLPKAKMVVKIVEDTFR